MGQAAGSMLPADTCYELELWVSSPAGPQRSGGAAKRLDEARGGGYPQPPEQRDHPGPFLASTPGSFLESAEGLVGRRNSSSQRGMWTQSAPEVDRQSISLKTEPTGSVGKRTVRRIWPRSPARQRSPRDLFTICGVTEGDPVWANASLS